MQNAELEAKLRSVEKNSEKTNLRNSGMIPAVVYGKGFKNLLVSIDLKKFGKTISGEAGHNVIISLKISDGEKKKDVSVLTHEIQRDPLTDRMIHVDFMHVDMKKPIKAMVPIVLKGTAIGVKDHGGIIVHGLREVEVKCLPGDIPGHLIVDVTSLEVNSSLHVSDMIIPDGIEMISSMEDTIVNISPPAKEEEVAPAEEGAEALPPSEKGAVGEELPPSEKGGEKKEESAAAGEKKAPAVKEKKEEKK